MVAGYSAANAVVARFDEGGGFNQDDKVTYPNEAGDNKVRKLKTVASTTTWTPQMPGFTFTDIMGDPITLEGAALIEHHVFIAIKGGNRTILMIG